jgi:SPOR domain
MRERRFGVRVRGLSLVVLLTLISLGAFAGCGGDGDSAADELAKQRELAAARQEGAQEAHQSERIKQLERELNGRAEEAGATPEPPPATPTSGAPEPAEPDDDWPGGSGYTAMLGAFSSESNARARQSEATARGIDAGLLWSSDYSSLNPGYWVVFSGTFPTSTEARERASRASELGYADSYPRFVSR